MSDDLEKITKFIYSEWKSDRRLKIQKHPNEEDLACFLDGNLTGPDKLLIEKHLVNCDVCAEYVSAHLLMRTTPELNLPDKLLEHVRKLVLGQDNLEFFEILLKLKEKIIEIIQTSGDVLVGQELIPAPILRSRQIKDFNEEITILKDLQKIRVEIKLKNNNAKSFNLEVNIKDKASQQLIENLRVVLLRDKFELESYAYDKTSVTFKDILPGDYTIEVSNLEEKVAIVAISVKV